MLRSYLRLVLFALGLLIGLQVPGFIADYAKRVEAHRLEAEQGLSGFRQTAQRFFQGDLDALVAHYRASDDAVMRSDADSVAHLVARAKLLDKEWAAMQGAWYVQVLHLATAADRRLLRETWDGYSYQVLLSPTAIAWGLCAALLLAWLVESVLLLVAGMLGFGRERRARQRHWG
ncbi:DUF2937 family protein [Zestomonas carbonaria]|uniref:DUF2937 family protein n=1 Tax=Zestomonas carbonaria TaxID=2762745 RepID=A0A7U7I9F8_9GAMM|nr:DUF2937 family protein [Pseudomonas carbonaria]CAD5107736.1 hypothetical protein PSEWESI4_02011 [Pseudomonas carbonaria]